MRFAEYTLPCILRRFPDDLYDEAMRAGIILGLLAFCLLMLGPLRAQAPLPDDPCLQPPLTKGWDAIEKSPPPEQPEDEETAARQASALIAPVLQQLIALRFAELGQVEVHVRSFNSKSDYFRTRFSFSRFLTFRKMRYFVDVNPRLLELSPPARGVCAILGMNWSTFPA
jgi:hypothetical protein